MQFDIMEGRNQISAWTATALVVANMVGTGVFTSLGFQVAAIPSVFPVLMLWAIGGVVALCGALCYGELAAALPRSGGEYHFLSRIFHPSIGFMAGCLSATVGFSAPAALAAMAFGKYLHGVYPGAPERWSSLLLVWVVTFIHLTSVRAGSLFQNFFTGFKLLLIAAFVAAGLIIGTPQPVPFSPVTGDGHLIFSGPFAVSLVYVMYAYSGWNAATYIVHEIREPRRNVPRALAYGTVLVSVLYLALNAVFLHTTPINRMAGKLDIGLIVGNQVFGALGGRVMGGLICVGMISAVSAMIWIGPRVASAMGEDFRALRRLSRHTRAGVPGIAMVLQLLIITVLLLTSTFNAVLMYIQFSLTLCSSLTVLGLIVLRWREPALPRPYRVLGYPFTPLVFLALSGYMLYFVARSQPRESLTGIATMLLALLLYFIPRIFVKEPGPAHELHPPSDPPYSRDGSGDSLYGKLALPKRDAR